MEKEILQKIYNLRKVKPDSDWVEKTKESILKEDAVFDGSRFSFSDYFAIPAFRNGLTVAGACAFLLAFVILAFPLLPSNYESNFAYIPAPVGVVEERDKVREVSEEDEVAAKRARLEDPVRSEYDLLMSVYRELQSEVLGTRFNTEDPKEMAERALEEMKEMGVDTKQAEDAFEEEDYFEVLDIYLEQE